MLPCVQEVERGLFAVAALSWSRVDSNDFPTAASHQQHSFQAFGQHLQKLHVCAGTVKDQRLPKRQSIASVSRWQWIQFSSPSRFLGGPGMLSSTNRASWDLLTITSFSFTAVCIRRTLDWSLEGSKTATRRICADEKLFLAVARQIVGPGLTV